MTMSPGMRLVLWLVVVPVAIIGTVVGAGAWMVFKRPLTVDAWSTRRALVRAGLERRWVSALAGRVAVWQGGEGAPLLLLHGANDQAGTWAELVPPLLDGHHLLIPDLPGHGDSEPADGPLGIDTVLAGVQAVLDERGDGPVTVVGNSLGGWIAMLLAVERPQRVARLVLINGGALRGSSGVNLMPADRDEARQLMSLMRSPASPQVPGFVLDDVVRLTSTGPLARLHATVDEMELFVLDGRLDEVQAPVDLLWGVDDQVMPVDYARRLLAGLPAARLTTIADCGHVPQRECPAACAEALARILGQPPPTPPSLNQEAPETP